MEHRFDVYGRVIIIERSGNNSWHAYYQGADGKRGRASFPVPSHLAAKDLATYLEELFHESATPERPAVVELKE